MTVQAILIAPYRAFAEQFHTVLSEHQARATRSNYEVYDFDLKTIIADGPEALSSVDLDCDVVVARGFTAQDLAARNSYIPVVEIAVGATDLLRGVNDARERFPGKRLAILGSPNMLAGLQSVNELMHANVEAFQFASRREIARKVRELKQLGYRVILGGVKTCECAAHEGLDSILLESGSEAMWHAISEARKVAYISRQARERTQSLSTVLNQTNEGIVFLNRDHQIDVFNLAASRILGIQANRALGKRIDQVLHSDQLASFLSSSKARKDEIIETDRGSFAISRCPVHILGDRIGTVLTFQDVSHIQQLEGRIRVRMHRRGHVARHTFDDIIGTGTPVARAIVMAKRYSQVDSNVLITGQTGTGKELFAQSIHNGSPRSDGPFVAVNCAALPESLLESELFGYVDGAFTGAAKGGKPGLFEIAHGGTIFLDEISEMPARLQGHLLRVIEEKEIMRLGHDRVIPINVRIISAANRNLPALVKSGEFREDLYYRLHILHLELPSLDERKMDIPEVVDHWVRWYATEFSSPETQVTDAAKLALARFSWPGNVRQLRAVCEQLVVLSQTRVIDSADVHELLGNGNGSTTVSPAATAAPDVETNTLDFAESMQRFERERIVLALQKSGYNRTMAAEQLGVSRTTLWRYMHRLGL